jgi:hypothetical protein
MWKYGDRIITSGKAWTDSNGVQHPSNWHFWTKEEKDKYGITEIIPETAPDSRLYNWTVDTDGKIQNKKAKELEDSGSGESKVLGLKSQLVDSVKEQQHSLLVKTDWYFIRKTDKGTAVPSNIQTWRDAIRTKATEMENAIKSASDIDAVASLFVVRDDEGKIASGVLYDWPNLGD